MFSRYYMQSLEKQVTAALRAVAIDEARKNKSNKTRKVVGFKFPKNNRVRRFEME